MGRKGKKMRNRISSGGPDYEEFAAHFYANVRATSSTALGREESKTKPGKPRLGFTGAALEARIRTNSYEVARVILQATEEEWGVRRTLRSILRATHEGFSPRLAGYRTYPTAARYGARPQKIPPLMRVFKGDLARRLDHPDTIRLAAWVEWQLDEVIHPFGDGCGRVSKALAAWVLTRRHFPLPHYGDRERYHRAIRDGFRAFLAYYRSCVRLSPRRPTVHAEEGEERMRAAS